MTATELVDKAGGLVPAIVLVATCLNVGLSALSTILGKVKDLTATSTDNKLFDAINGVTSLLQKIVDFISANIQHKPEEVKK